MSVNEEFIGVIGVGEVCHVGEANGDGAEDDEQGDQGDALANGGLPVGSLATRRRQPPDVHHAAEHEEAAQQSAHRGQIGLLLLAESDVAQQQRAKSEECRSHEGDADADQEEGVAVPQVAQVKIGKSLLQVPAAGQGHGDDEVGAEPGHFFPGHSVDDEGEEEPPEEEGDEIHEGGGADVAVLAVL